MKKQILSTIISLSLLPPFLPLGVLAQDNNIAFSLTPIILAQTDPLEEAIQLYQQAQELRQQGQYQQAEQLYQQSLNLATEALGPEHPDLAFIYFELGILDHLQLDFASAKLDYENAIGVNPEFIAAIANLGLMAYEQGQIEQAIEYWQSALEIENSVEVRLALAVTFYQQGKEEQGLSLAREALGEDVQYGDLAFLEQNLWGENLLRDTNILLTEEQIQTLITEVEEANQLEQQGIELYQQGKYIEATNIFERVLEIRKRIYPEDHPDVATSLNSLALLYNNQGRYAEAEPLYNEALAMRKRIYPEDHPDVATSLNNLGVFYQGQRQYPQALDLFTQASVVEEAIIAENLLIGSEQQKKQFLDLFRGSTNVHISFHLQAVPDNQSAANLALTTILRRKGRVLDAMGQVLQVLREQSDPAIQELFNQLATTQTQLATLSSRPLPDNPIQRKQIQTQQTQLASEIQRLEGELSTRSAEFRTQTTPVTISAVQEAIPSNAALIEFIEYKPFNPQAAQNERWGDRRYAVYILLPTGQVQWLDLGEASIIDTKIERFRNQINQGANIRGLGVVATEIVAENIITDTKEAARELDEIIMAPVRELIGDATHLLISPDSNLNLIPFAALVDEQNQYLVENYLITYLTSGRDLLRLELFQDETPSTPVLVANPTFDAPGVENPQLVASGTPSSRGETSARRSGELQTLQFGPLPGTKVEGEIIAGLVDDLIILTEQEASENNLKQQSRPEFLHIATHGFFLPPQTRDTNVDDESWRTMENPLLRSGLALAGFNQRNSGSEDGVLTAFEVTGLNLRGTRLVVLSACETGLGDVEAGEGVYGLRRAFTLAGAESQLMSLWSVSDEGTQELMVAYYQRLQNGEERGEALRQVQLEMLQSEGREHPFYWAAFIPSGAWSALE